MVKGLVLASGFAPALLTLIARAGANSKVPVIPGIQEMSGDVRINGTRATVGQVVNPGDVVTTGADGDCVIIIGEHVYLIRQSSEVEFYREDFEQTTDGFLSGTIKIAFGSMLSVFGKTDTVLQTPLATIGIRGTACYISAKPDKTYACVCYGQADLGGTEDGLALETVTTMHHDSPRYIYPKGSVVRIEKAPVVDHTDAQLRMLEALVNRRPSFDKFRFQRNQDGY
jgi:hypothetical protein